MLQPDYPSALGLLSHLNSDELKEMLNDDSKFDIVLRDVKQIKDWETEKEMIIASNRSLAEFNLAREPEMSEAKEKIQDLSAQGEEICGRIQEKLEDYKSKSSGLSSDTTQALLQTLAAQSEEQSETLAQNFLSGEIDLEQFLEEFPTLRTKMHIRKFKADKMSELIRSNSKFSYFGNGQQNQYTPYPPQGVPYPPSQSVPYPVGPVAMPMPGMFRNHF